MWYEEPRDKGKQIRKDKPIFTIGVGSTFILLPQIGTAGSYSPCGYNWFDMARGVYNSCAFYKTVEEAIEAYSEASYSYKISNGNLRGSFEDEI